MAKLHDKPKDNRKNLTVIVTLIIVIGELYFSYHNFVSRNKPMLVKLIDQGEGNLVYTQTQQEAVRGMGTLTNTTTGKSKKVANLYSLQTA